MLLLLCTASWFLSHWCCCIADRFGLRLFSGLLSAGCRFLSDPSGSRVSWFPSMRWITWFWTEPDDRRLVSDGASILSLCGPHLSPRRLPQPLVLSILNPRTCSSESRSSSWQNSRDLFSPSKWFPHFSRWCFQLQPNWSCLVILRVDIVFGFVFLTSCLFTSPC